MTLAINDPANCPRQVLDGVNASVHYHDVDNPAKTTFVMASMWNAGLRIFDVRAAPPPEGGQYFNPGDVHDAVGRAGSSTRPGATCATTNAPVRSGSRRTGGFWAWRSSPGTSSVGLRRGEHRGRRAAPGRHEGLLSLKAGGRHDRGKATARSVDRSATSAATSCAPWRGAVGPGTMPKSVRRGPRPTWFARLRAAEGGGPRLRAGLVEAQLAVCRRPPTSCRCTAYRSW